MTLCMLVKLSTTGLYPPVVTLVVVVVVDTEYLKICITFLVPS